MKTSSKRTRVWPFLAALLVIANAVVWAPQVLVTPVQAATTPSAGQCHVGSTPEAADAAVRSWALANDIDFAMVTDPPCANCTYMSHVGQPWCMLRAPDTDCDPGWFWDNFYYERTLTTLDCGASGVRAHCGAWQWSGCCNNSSDAPACAGGGHSGICTGALPPQ